MPLSRRLFIKHTVLAATSWPLLDRPLHLQALATPEPSIRPNPTTFESGDLIWPKLPGEFIRYAGRDGASQQSDSDQWRSERDAYLASLRSRPSSSLTTEDRERFQALRDMSYREFVATYLKAEGAIEKMDGGDLPLASGHVAILDLRSGSPVVIEAIWGTAKKVRRLPYAEWLAGRPGELVWHGRLAEATPERRSRIAEIAATYIGKPYDFWNFNLEDDSGFYCSKLAWLSIRRALDFAPDDRLDPRRVLWYSPLQLMRSRHVVLLFSPGSYREPRR